MAWNESDTTFTSTLMYPAPGLQRMRFLEQGVDDRTIQA